MLFRRHLQWSTAFTLVLLSLGAQAATGPLLPLTILEQTPQLLFDASQAESTPPARGLALNYADRIPLNLDSRQDGRWSAEDGQAVWRLELGSAEAVNLSVRLQAFIPGADSELRLYDAQGHLWQGPYSSADLQDSEKFHSPIVPGEGLLLEWRIPTAAQDQAWLQIDSLFHGYRDVRAQSKSGSCNIDTACSSADSWTDAVRATARISVGGRRLCSAVLLNNVREDGRPLLLTAEHCGIDEIGDFSASSLIVYWNYERSQCGGNADGSLSQNQRGSRLLAENSSSDFALVELNQRPPAHYRVYYAGWDASGLTPSRGVSVHHPSGDEKAISFYEGSARAARFQVDGQAVDSWAVNWDRGVTEAGSSGAGLWNSRHQIIGQLSGGNSSCSNPDGTDVYGRFDLSFDRASSADAQLKAWLDPDNTGRQQMSGLDSGDADLLAQEDQFLSLPGDAQSWRLDVLRNDGGVAPLRIVDVQADSGQARIIGQDLEYRFAEGSNQDRIRYQLINRWGESQWVDVSVQRDLGSARGGALGLVLLPGLILLLIWRRRS